ncbi:hypothetical protein [Streptomyces sp. NPDC006691]|uniref:hypothetical protein n=1 Tax=Streptomyces sp. NPDC006691 TaxID=3364757 RepID=UPI003690A31C
MDGVELRMNPTLWPVNSVGARPHGIQTEVHPDGEPIYTGISPQRELAGHVVSGRADDEWTLLVYQTPSAARSLKARPAAPARIGDP